MPQFTIYDLQVASQKGKQQRTKNLTKILSFQHMSPGYHQFLYAFSANTTPSDVYQAIKKNKNLVVDHVAKRKEE